MNENEFYPFKKSIEHERDLGFDESGWDALNKRLDEADRRKRRPIAGWWMWIAAAMLPLILGNVFLFKNLQETKELNRDLLTRLDEFSAWQKHHRDTVFQKEIVYISDTVTHIVYRDRMMQPAGFQQQMAALSRFSTGEAQPSSAGNQLLEGANAPLNQCILPNGIKQEPATSNNTKETLSTSAMPDFIGKPGLDLFPGRLVLRTDLKVADIPPGKRKRKHLLQAALYPQGIEAGVSGAAVLPLAKGLKDKNGQAFGLTTELLFHGGLRLWADISYLELQYASETMDPELGIPVVDPPSDDFVFSDAKVMRKSFTYTLGMKRVWNRNGKWQPFIGLGYGVAHLRPYKVLYDFENKPLNVDQPLEKEIHQNSFEKDIVHIGAGLEYRMLQNLRLKVESFYRRQFGNQPSFNPDYLGLKASLNYRF